MLFLSGLSTKLIKRTIIIIVLISPLLYLAMADHQKVRIEAFLNPEGVTLQGNYQVMQSMIAIGSGIVGVKLAETIVDAFAKSNYSGGRHQIRIDMLNKML